MATEFRIDASPSRGIKELPDGSFELPAYVTRTGIFEYTYSDGSKKRELRHPDDVFSADSLASLRGCTVTDGHPVEREVKASNWRQLAVGHVGDVSGKAEGDLLGASIFVKDSATCSKVRTKALSEISAGYFADYDETPGTYNGAPYDRRQYNIRYNHIALGPVNWGRAGRRVGLRLDSTYIVDMESHTAVSELRNDDVAAVVPVAPPVAVLDAKDFVSKPVHDAALGENAVLKSQVVTLSTEIAALKLSTSPIALDALCATRTALIARAHVIAKDLKCDGLTAAEIMAAALAAADPTLKLDSESADYVKAAFDMTVKTRAIVNDSIAAAAAVTAPAGDLGVASTVDRLEQARIDMGKRNAAAFKAA